MYPLSILAAVAGVLVAFAVGHDESCHSSANTCTTTATVSVTTDVLASIAARSSPIPTALPATVPESFPSAAFATSPLIPLTESAAISAVSSLVASSPASEDLGTASLPVFTSSIPPLKPITNISEFLTQAAQSTTSLSNSSAASTTSTVPTKTSTSSASSITTSTTSRGTSTSTAGGAAATTTNPAPQPGSGASGLQANSANLALAVFAGAMLLL